MADKFCILGIRINNRIKETGNLQRVLTQFGCSIKTRLGIHEVSESHCSVSGLIILEFTGPTEEQEKMKMALKAIEGITMKEMVF